MGPAEAWVIQQSRYATERELLRDIEATRHDLDVLLNELNRRKSNALNLRLQMASHPVALGLTGMVLLGGAGLYAQHLMVRRRRERSLVGFLSRPLGGQRLPRGGHFLNGMLMDALKAGVTAVLAASARAMASRWGPRPAPAARPATATLH